MKKMSDEIARLSRTCLYLAHRLREVEEDRDDAWEDIATYRTACERLEKEKNEAVRIKSSYKTAIMAINKEVAKIDLELKERFDKILSGIEV